MSRANTDLQQIQVFVVMIPLTISNLALVVAVAVILLTIDPLLALCRPRAAAARQRPRQAVLRRTSTPR